MGGKSLLTKEILPFIPKHHCYVEVFCGAAWMFFRKAPSKVEILNDVNSELTTLYRVVQNHVTEFMRQFEYMLVARDEFDRFLMSPPETLTDIQRAVRFYMLLRTGYGARIDNPTFSVSAVKTSNFNINTLPKRLAETHERLARVTIENRPYKDVIKRFDTPDTFMYSDPPYHNCEDYYGKGIFSEEDFVTLQELMTGLKGKMILSINDTPFIRETFENFHITEVDTTYTVAGANKQKKVTELLISNFELKAV